MLGTKSVHAVFASPVIWLPWSPKSKTAYFFVGPNERSFHTPVIQSNPASSTIVPVLNVYVFFLVVNSHQTWAHCSTVWFSGQPRGACGTCEVAVTAKVAPSWQAYVCKVTRSFESQSHVLILWVVMYVLFLYRMLESCTKESRFYPKWFRQLTKECAQPADYEKSHVSKDSIDNLV